MILNLYGITFHPAVVLGPEHDFLFKSASTYCGTVCNSQLMVQYLPSPFLTKFCYYLGGFDGNTWLKTTEIIYPNGSKTEGPIELPEQIASHCMVEYAGIIILMGGQYASHN